MAICRVKEDIYVTEAEASERVFTLRMGMGSAIRSNFLSIPFNLNRTPEFQMKVLHEEFDGLVKECISTLYERGAIHLLMTKMDALTRSKLYLHFDSPKTLYSVMQHILRGDIFDPSCGFMGFCCHDDNAGSAEMYNNVATLARNRGKTIDDVSYTLRTEYVNEMNERSFLMSVMYKKADGRSFSKSSLGRR